MTSPSNEQTPVQPEGGQPGSQGTAVVGPHRPWLGPAIAAGVLAAVILLLLIPNVLIYPRALAAAPSLPAGVVEKSNEALEERAKKLRALVQSGVCEADGRYRLMNPTPGGPSQQDLDNIIPPELSENAPADPTAPADAQSQNAFLDTVDKGVSLIFVPQGQMMGMGTGFFISPDLVVTNAHVADAPVGSRVQVLNKAIGKPVEAVIEATSGYGETGQRDFALLRLQGATAPKVLSIAATPERMQTIVAAGFPGIIMDTDPNFQSLMRGDFSHLPDPSTSSGMVTHVQDQRDPQVVIHNAQMAKGNSGGPLLDRCGRVGGVNTFIASFNDQSRLNYSLGSESLIVWLRENNVNVTADTAACAPSAPAVEEQE